MNRKNIKPLKKNIEYYKNNELEKMVFDNININRNNKIIISLTSTPNRFLSDSFEKIIDTLLSQSLSPDIIVVNLCEEYRRKFYYDSTLFAKKIAEYKNDKVVLNICKTDYGPATKILGLMELQHEYEDDDLIIVVDDDINYINNLVLLYELNYLIYGSDIICIDEKNYFAKSTTIDIFTSPYKGGTLYGWMSWAIKYKFLRHLYEYYIDYINIDEELWKHDDLFFSMFYNERGLTSSEIKIKVVLNISENDNYLPLRCDNLTSGNYRHRLENKYKEKLKNIVKNVCVNISDCKSFCNIDFLLECNSVRFIKN